MEPLDAGQAEARRLLHVEDPLAVHGEDADVAGPHEEDVAALRAHALRALRRFEVVGRDPLSDLAVEIIREQLAENRRADAKRQQRLARRMTRAVGARPIAESDTDVSKYIFPGPGARAPVTVFGIVGAIAHNRTHFGIAPFTSRDLRRTVATRMEEIGISPFIVAHVLGHISVTKSSITSKVYARYDYAREKCAAVKRWEAHLRGIIDGTATADVLPLFDRERA